MTYTISIAPAHMHIKVGAKGRAMQNTDMQPRIRGANSLHCDAELNCAAKQLLNMATKRHNFRRLGLSYRCLDRGTRPDISRRDLIQFTFELLH